MKHLMSHPTDQSIDGSHQNMGDADLNLYENQRQAVEFLEDNRDRIEKITERDRICKIGATKAILEIGLNRLEAADSEWQARTEAFLENEKADAAMETVIEALLGPIKPTERDRLKQLTRYELLNLYNILRDGNIDPEHLEKSEK